jgi:hypothetical protein
MSNKKFHKTFQFNNKLNTKIKILDYQQKRIEL